MIDAKMQGMLRDAAFTIDLTGHVTFDYIDNGRPHIVATWRGLKVTRLVTPDNPIDQCEADAVEMLNIMAASLFLDLLSMAVKEK